MLKVQGCMRPIVLTAISIAMTVGCSTGSKSSNGATSSKAENASQIPLEDFFKNPQQTGFAISPDGKYISYLAPANGRMNVFVQPRDRSTPPVQLTDVRDRDIAGQFWKGDHSVVFLRDFGGDENYQLFSINVETKKTLALTPFEGIRTELIDDLDQIDDDHVIIGLNKRVREAFDAHRLNVKTGELTLIAENPGNYMGWVTDHAGRLRMATASDGVNSTIFVRDDEKQKFRKLLSTSFKETVSPLFFTFDNKNVYASSNRKRDKSSIVTLDLKTGKEKVLFSRPDVDVFRLSFSKKRKVLWSSIFTTWKNERFYFDDVFKSVVTDIEKQVPNTEIAITGYDKAERFFLAQASSDVTRGATYVYDSETKKLEKLADHSPWLDAGLMSEMKPVEYKSRDGLTIHGYLTVPRGKDPKNLPVVINPHGGPWHRDSWRFNSEVQFLASRGYAVFQPNFRGSTGYGRKFWEASFKQWGKKMQDDVTDGVKYLVDQKIADPTRVCIYGGSYGGYATLAGLAFTPDLYRCGVDYVGVSNLFTFLNTIPPYWKPMLAMLHEMVGHAEKDKALLESASPVFHVDKIKAPLFVAQGAKDPRVNINESNQVVDALRKRGITVQYMVKENEGHGFHNEENRFDFYRAMEKFLAENLK